MALDRVNSRSYTNRTLYDRSMRRKWILLSKRNRYQFKGRDIRLSLLLLEKTCNWNLIYALNSRIISVKYRLSESVKTPNVNKCRDFVSPIRLLENSLWKPNKSHIVLNLPVLVLHCFKIFKDSKKPKITEMP